MTIGKRISEERKKLSLSQEYIAEKLGVSRQAVSKWETDATSPDTANLIALSELFGVSVEYLATGKLQAGQKSEKPSFGTARICGFIFLGAGLLSLVLGVLLSEILLLISFAMIIIGVLCISVKRHLGAILAIVFAVPTFLYLTVFMVRPNLKETVITTDPSGPTVAARAGSIIPFLILSLILIALSILAFLWIKRKKK